MRVLLIEDDAQLAQSITTASGGQDWSMEWTPSGAHGLERAASGGYAAILVDRMLPAIDGLEIVRRLRTAGNTVPAIFITTMGSVDDRVEALDAGGDDYLVKPFAMTELVARVNAAIRRSFQSGAVSRLTLGDLEMNLLSRTVTRAGRIIDLLPQEMKLLEYFLRHKEQMITKKMIIEEVWGFTFDPKTSVVETQISRMRAKIDRGFEREYLKTSRGVGYRLSAKAS